MDDEPQPPALAERLAKIHYDTRRSQVGQAMGTDWGDLAADVKRRYVHAMSAVVAELPGHAGPELAQQIEITHERRFVVIDGQPFPWFLADEPVLVEVHPRQRLPVVVLRVLADAVTVSTIGWDHTATLTVRDAAGALVGERRVGSNR